MLSVYSDMGLDLSQATVARQQQNLTQYHEFMSGGCFSLAPYDASPYYGNLAMPTSAGATNGNDWYMNRMAPSSITTAPTNTSDMLTAASTTTTLASAAAAIAPTTVCSVGQMGYVDRSASYYPSPVINTPPPTTLSGMPVDACVYPQPMVPSPISAVTMHPPVVMPPSPTYHQHHPGYPDYLFPGSPMDDGCNTSLSSVGLTSSPYNYTSPLLMHYHHHRQHHHHHPYNGLTRRSSMHTSRSSSPSTLSSVDTPSASTSTSTSCSSSSSSSSSSISNSPSVYYHPQRPLMATFNTKATSSTPKRYKCNICGKKFTRPSSLKTHTYSHTGEKPFKCPVEGCGRHFSVVSNLRRHAKTHGNIIPATPSTTTTTTTISSVHSSS